jgi:hypothetical protein
MVGLLINDEFRNNWEAVRGFGLIGGTIVTLPLRNPK